MQENTAAEDAQAFGTSPDDPVFAAEQAHLSEVYAELEKMRGELVRKMEATSAAAARDKLDLLSEISNDFTSDTETSETYASYGAVNSVIDSYNAQQEVTADKLARCRLLLRQPYFAKVALQFKPGQPPKELYSGAAGISDDNYKRLVVDWRSPVAETYYNQSNGATSYVANGRTIDVDLACRRQFDIEADTLHAYFDTTVAIQDALLLESLSHQRTAQMKAITATIQREQNEVVRHEDVPALLVVLPKSHRARPERSVPHHAEPDFPHVYRECAARHGRAQSRNAHVGGIREPRDAARQGRREEERARLRPVAH